MRKRLRPHFLGPVVLGPVMIPGCVYGEEFAGPGEVGAASAVGKEAVMADAVESRGQDMEQEAAHELGCFEGHGLVSLAAF